MKSISRSVCVMLMIVACSSIAVAFQVYGEIGKKWQSLGGQNGFLGAPLNDETGTPDGIGRFNHFQRGSIYWTPQTGAHEVHGSIRDKWTSLSWERGFLGYPVSDESGTPDGVGRFNHFQRGSIYWTPQTGAHEVHGAIRDAWASKSWERGSLRYPTSDEYQDGAYRRSNFQNGYIRWSPQQGAVAFVTGGNRSCAHCNDGSCQCGFGTPAELCADHRGDDPKIGCTDNQ